MRIYYEKDEAQTEKTRNEALEREVDTEDNTNISEAEETINILTKDYKEKVEALESENARLREELSKKASL